MNSYDWHASDLPTGTDYYRANPAGNLVLGQLGSEDLFFYRLAAGLEPVVGPDIYPPGLLPEYSSPNIPDNLMWITDTRFVAGVGPPDSAPTTYDFVVFEVDPVALTITRVQTVSVPTEKVVAFTYHAPTSRLLILCNEAASGAAVYRARSFTATSGTLGSSVSGPSTVTEPSDDTSASVLVPLGPTTAYLDRTGTNTNRGIIWNTTTLVGTIVTSTIPTGYYFDTDTNSQQMESISPIDGRILVLEGAATKDTGEIAVASTVLTGPYTSPASPPAEFSGYTLTGKELFWEPGGTVGLIVLWSAPSPEDPYSPDLITFYSDVFGAMDYVGYLVPPATDIWLPDLGSVRSDGNDGYWMVVSHYDGPPVTTVSTAIVHMPSGTPPLGTAYWGVLSG